MSLREKYANTKDFLVRIFLYLDWIRRFSLNTGKYGPEKTPYLDTFHDLCKMFSPRIHSSNRLLKTIIFFEMFDKFLIGSTWLPFQSKFYNICFWRYKKIIVWWIWLEVRKLTSLINICERIRVKNSKLGADVCLMSNFSQDTNTKCIDNCDSGVILENSTRACFFSSG